MVKFVMDDKPDDARLQPFLEYHDTTGEVFLGVKELGRADSKFWYILSLTKEGKLRLSGGISKKVGLTVDENGQIEIEDTL